MSLSGGWTHSLRHDGPWGSREAAIADYGVVLTGEPDEDLVSYDAAATDAARATRPALAEVLFDRGPGRARLCGGVWYADVDVVGS